MKFFYEILIALLCCCYIWGKCLVTDNNNNLLNSLVTVLKQNTKIDQVLLLYEKDFNNCGIYQMGKNISRILPTEIADFRRIINVSNSQRVPMSLVLLQTTMVLIIPTGNVNKNKSIIYNVLNCIAELSKPKTRPKVLIIESAIVKVSSNYQKFFENMWLKQFLDITILEIMEKSSIVIMHHYNPFERIFHKETFSNGSILFPDKLRNLNGYRMKAGMFHYPPYVYVEKYSNGHVKFHGPDISWMIVMSNYLNFSLDFVFSNASNWDLVNCDKNKNVGITNQTINNEIQFINIQAAIYETCLNNFVAISRGTKMFRFVALAPILPSEMTILRNLWALLNIMCVLSLFLIPLLLAKYLNFERKNWQIMYAVQMVLGFPTPKMPKKTPERIIMLSLLFFYFLQSSYIFTTFSEMQLQKKSFQKMETFQDLLDANLTLVTNANISEGGGLDNSDAYEKMMMHAIISEDTLAKWVEVLIMYENITYICREHLALLNLQKRGQKVKIIKEIQGLWPSGIYLAEGSPYKYQFDRTMSVFMESGLSNKWDAAYIPKSISKPSHNDLFHQETSLMSKVRAMMIAILLFGFSCSIFVFVAEFLIH